MLNFRGNSCYHFLHQKYLEYSSQTPRHLPCYKIKLHCNMCVQKMFIAWIYARQWFCNQKVYISVAYSIKTTHHIFHNQNDISFFSCLKNTVHSILAQLIRTMYAANLVYHKCISIFVHPHTLVNSVMTWALFC